MEEKGEETGDRVAELGDAENCEGVMIPDNNSTAGNRKGNDRAGSISSEDRVPL